MHTEAHANTLALQLCTRGLISKSVSVPGSEERAVAVALRLPSSPARNSPAGPEKRDTVDDSPELRAKLHGNSRGQYELRYTIGMGGQRSEQARTNRRVSLMLTRRPLKSNPKTISFTGLHSGPHTRRSGYRALKPRCCNLCQHLLITRVGPIVEPYNRTEVPRIIDIVVSLLFYRTDGRGRRASTEARTTEFIDISSDPFPALRNRTGFHDRAFGNRLFHEFCKRRRARIKGARYIGVPVTRQPRASYL